MEPGSREKPSPAADLAKRLDRRQALKALGAALSGLGVARLSSGGAVPAAIPASPPVAPAGAYRPLATGTVPQSFTPEEFAGLEQLVELIIPTTDTPGARAAGVHWYLDQAAQVEPRTRQQLKDGLKRLDARTRAAFGKSFTEATEEQQVQVLTAMAGVETGVAVEVTEAGQNRVEDPSAAGGNADHVFFEFAKARVIDGYYKSEIGQLGELQWVGHEFNDAFPGACKHPGALVHPRPTWTTRAASRPSWGGAR